jgi:hypothetical protein
MDVRDDLAVQGGRQACARRRDPANDFRVSAEGLVGGRSSGKPGKILADLTPLPRKIGASPSVVSGYVRFL